MGPIIEEHQTSLEMAAGTSRTYNVKASGRAMRAFCRYEGDAGGTEVTFYVKPLGHYSFGSEAHDWPVISSGQTDGVVVPDTGVVVTTGSGLKKQEIFVSSNFSCAEYEVKVSVATADASRVTVLTELI